MPHWLTVTPTRHQTGAVRPIAGCPQELHAANEEEDAPVDGPASPSASTAAMRCAVVHRAGAWFKVLCIVQGGICAGSIRTCPFQWLVRAFLLC